ncbi:MAG: AAA family ATPase [Bacteroidales bacterium]|nr:AAA family ATPase [Bacteroidales bacterium]
MEKKKSTKEILASMPECKNLIDDLGLELKKKSLLECFEEVIERARNREYGRGYDEYFSLDDKLIAAKRFELETIAEEYGISEWQAALFAIVLELSKGDCISQGRLAERLKTSFISYLSIEKDLRELEKKFLIKINRRGLISVSNEVIELLRENKPFHKPSYEGLSTSIILSKMNRLFNDYEQANIKLLLEEVDNMILSNPTTSIAKAADSYHILIEGDEIIDPENSYDYLKSMNKNERMLFYALIYRYDHYNDDECDWWDFRGFFEEYEFDSMQANYKEHRLGLQRMEVIEYANIDGMSVKDRFRLKAEVKEKIFADVGGVRDRAPMAGLIEYGTIDTKALFYDDAVQKQVKTLESILSQERFPEIREMMESKGMRTGFASLFYGAPGTGKTETVYQLAKRTGRDLITADVTKIKSYWVGESEKNIKDLFRKYRSCVKESKVTPILLFNEADAIFGIRMEGADRAVEKMENSIQNIILQEMENLDGILIATTNLTQNLDKAFERRFLYKIKFDIPSVEVKSRIWQSMIPDLDEEHTRKLASMFNFSGGQIENVSRKKMVQSIITGTEPSYEEMVEFCREETIEDSRKSANRIGF